MSELFYNRDRNVTGVSPITGLTFSPNQGSSVVFTTNTFENNFPNRVKSQMGRSLNSVSAEYNLSFSVRETEAAQILDYLESRSGVLPVVLQDDSSIYKTISGFADEFSTSVSNNNSFEVACKLVVDNRSVKNNWSGLAFLNFDFKEWQTGESVQKYAIRYFEHDSSNKFNNYFYCTEDHLTSLDTAPFASGSPWAQDLFFASDSSFSISTNPDVARINFANSFPIRITNKKNIHSIDGLTLRFSNVSEAKAKALLHFAESKFGETRFLFENPKLYKPKVFYCPTWRHTWGFFNHTVEFDLVEDPLGILPKNNSPTISFVQNNGWQNLTYELKSENGVNIVSFDGGERLNVLDGESQKTWDNTSVKHNIDVFGNTTGISVSNQRINSVVVGGSSKLKSIVANNNQMTHVELNESQNVEEIDFSFNSLSSLSVDGLSNLKSLDISSNRIAELEISDCSSLTGFYGSGNLFSATQINSHLDALVNLQNYSGTYDVADGEYVDYENNAPLSGNGFVDASILGWRGWNLSFDNAKFPFVPSGYSSAVAHFKQESITGYVGGQSIFEWNDSIGGRKASNQTVSEFSRPQYIESAINQRSVLRFNGESWLRQTNFLDFPTIYGIFAVVKPASSGNMFVFSDRWERGLAVSGNKLVSKGNLTNNIFGELSGDSWNVVGIYNSGSSVSGAVNSQTATSASKSSNNIVFPGSIGVNYNSATGNFANFRPFIGDISEIVITSGVTDFAKMMRDLGAKHGLEIL